LAATRTTSGSCWLLYTWNLVTVALKQCGSNSAKDNKVTPGQINWVRLARFWLHLAFS